MIVEGKIFPYKRKICKLFGVAEQILNENFENVAVSVNFVSAEEIRRLNAAHRNVDRKTDVLSFPNLDKVAAQKLADFSAEIVDGQLFLGDIVICREVAKKQAKEYGHSVKREICFLALHGLLHLLGYDHIKSEDEKIMQEVADKILQEFGVPRK